MRWMSAVAVALVLVASCTRIDRPALTSFRPMADGTFQYVAKTEGIVYHEDDPADEATRMAWLQKYLRDNNMCPQGFVITERMASVTQNTPPNYDIYYAGKCS